MKIVGISGSLRKDSHHSALLRNAADLVPEGVEFEILDISDFPFFNSDLEAVGVPEAVLHVERAISDSDGVLFASPEYNGSYSGILKNAIDWFSRPPLRVLVEKPVALVGASPGRLGTARAQVHLASLLHSLNARVLSKPEVLISRVNSKVDDSGSLIDEETRGLYGHMLHAFVDHIKRLQHH
jgi:chromate reductase